MTHHCSSVPYEGHKLPLLNFLHLRVHRNSPANPVLRGEAKDSTQSRILGTPIISIVVIASITNRAVIAAASPSVTAILRPLCVRCSYLTLGFGLAAVTESRTRDNEDGQPE